MRGGLIQALVFGDRWSWLFVGVLWALIVVVVLLHRPARRSVFRTVLVLAVTSATSIAALPLATALGVPRLRYRAVEAPELVAPTGDTWRRLRGPLVAIVVGGVPDVAVPTIDAADQWVLFGLVTGHAVAGLPPAPKAAPEIGGPKLCRNDNETCRAWPAAWPDPTRAPSLAELVWEPEAAGALAFDVESGMFLRAIDGSGAEHDDRALEIVGRPTNDPSRDGQSALFIIRSFASGRLRAARIVASPAPAAGSAAAAHVFELQHAEVSVQVGPAALRWVVRPLLLLTSLALPIGLLFLVLAPALLRRRLARRGGTLRRTPAPVVIVPFPERDRASAVDPFDLGGAPIDRGTALRLAIPAVTAEPIITGSFLELPDHSVIAADPAPFRKIAWAWMSEHVATVAVFSAGLAAALPALVALVSLAVAR